MISFTNGASHSASIGQPTQIVCQAEGGIGNGGLTVTRTPDTNGTALSCSVTGANTVDCGSGLELTGALANDVMTATISIAEVACSDPGTYECSPTSDPNTKAVTQLDVTSK